ncbi:MAG: sialidase family protein [Acidobacteriota bacterium]
MIHSAHRFVIVTLFVALAAPSLAQTVVQSRGVDARVDYASLSRIGPWDDRNYQLTKEDLALLADNEQALSEGIPVFYRVQLRRSHTNMLREGKVQYPRSALPSFLIVHGGYLIDGKIYTQAERRGDRWHIDTSVGGVEEETFLAQRALEGEVRVTSPVGAAESTISINPTNPDQVVAGSMRFGIGQSMHFSSDGGETWTASAPLPMADTCCDPTIEWSVDGTKVYAASLDTVLSSVYVYRSADAGMTWTDFDTEPGNDPRRELGGVSADKEFLHVDRFPTSPHLDNLYLTWHASNVMQFSRSTDFGNTFTTLSFSADPTGIGSDITTDRAGTIFYFWPDFSGQRIVLKRSTDGGVSFDNGVVTVANTMGSFDFPIPSMESREVFIYNSAAADNTNGPFADSVYVAWTDSTAATGGVAADNHARIQVAFSRDGGDTWTVTTPHETADQNTVDRWHQWLAVGPDGKVYVMFYDTRIGDRTSVDVFYSVSDDGAKTWSEPTRLTSVTSPNLTGAFEFGDYNGMDVAIDRLITIFTDNRDESGGSAQSSDIYAAGLTLSTASEIFADGFENGGTSAWSAVNP